MSRTLVMPAVMGAWVVLVGLALIVVVLRGPYTHGNIRPTLDPGYTRTEQTTVGPPILFQGPGLASAQGTGDLVSHGRELMVAHGCADCHGIEGRGAVIGKPIVGFSADELKAKTRKGPGEMPAFDSESLDDHDLAAIAAYLDSLKTSH